MREGDRATMFEIFFDLVFVLALTRIVTFLEVATAPWSLVQGLVLVVLLWWAWTAFIWLGNHVRLDRGLALAGVVVAMSGLFVAALVLPGAWSQTSAALVLAAAFSVVRLSYVVVFVRVSRVDRRLRTQVLLDVVPLSLSSPLLILGALVGGTGQTALWGCAFAIDFGLGRLMSGYRGWRVRSPLHFVERHGLVLIVALGETLLSTGARSGHAVTDVRLVLAALLGFVIAAGLWWLYFSELSSAGEAALVQAAPAVRPALARDAYTLGHFPLVAGVVYVAFGIALLLDEIATSEAASGARLGTATSPEALGAGAICGGVVTYLVGLALFRWLTTGTARLRPAAVASGTLVLVAVVRPGSALTVLGLAALVVIVAAVVARRPTRSLVSRRANRSGQGGRARPVAPP